MTVESNADTASLLIRSDYIVTVEAKPGGECTRTLMQSLLLKCIILREYSMLTILCLLAAGTDILLPNGTTATLRLTPDDSSATFDIAVPCDGIVERINNQVCTLEFGTIEATMNETGILRAAPGEPAVVEIIDCINESEFLHCFWLMYCIYIYEHI